MDPHYDESKVLARIEASLYEQEDVDEDAERDAEIDAADMAWERMKQEGYY